MKIIMLLVCMFFINYSHAQITEGSFEGKKIIIKKVDASTAFIRVVMAAKNPDRCADADLVGVIMMVKGKEYAGYLFSEEAPKDLKEEQLYSEKIAVRFYPNKITVRSKHERRECLSEGDYKLDKK